MNETGIRCDFDLYEGQVLLQSDRPHGIWCVRTTLKQGRAVRLAGRVSPEATKHMLLAVGLAAALRSVTGVQWNKLRNIASTPVDRPRLQVVSTDCTFVDAMNELLAKRTGGPQLRVGHNLVVTLAKEVSRFKLTLVTEPDSTTTQVLRHWGRASLGANDLGFGSLVALMPEVACMATASA